MSCQDSPKTADKRRSSAMSIVNAPGLTPMNSAVAVWERASHNIRWSAQLALQRFQENRLHGPLLLPEGRHWPSHFEDCEVRTGPHLPRPVPQLATVKR